jgi:hypothetical protein
MSRIRPEIKRWADTYAGQYVDQQGRVPAFRVGDAGETSLALTTTGRLRIGEADLR